MTNTAPQTQEEAPGLSVLVDLSDIGGMYLSEPGRFSVKDVSGLKPEDSVLFQVNEITFEEEAPWKEALENVLSAAGIPGVNLVYLIRGTPTGVSFYYGLSRDYSTECELEGLQISEIGKAVLQASLRGNFRGSHVDALEPSEKNRILDKIKEMTQIDRIEGVVGSVKDDEKFQSVDRLVDAMQGDSFFLMVIAKAVKREDTARIEDAIYTVYDTLAPLQRATRQDGTSEGKSSSTSDSEGSSNSRSDSLSKTTGKGSGQSMAKSGSSNSSTSTSESGSETSGHSTTEGGSKSKTTQTGTSDGISHSISSERVNRRAQDWLKYCDEVLLPRLDYGKGKGLFTYAVYAFTNSAGVMAKLEHTVISLYSGKQGNHVPLRAFPMKNPKKADDLQLKAVYNLQMPHGSLICCDERQVSTGAFLSRPVPSQGEMPMGSWITTNELAMLAGLPRKELAGLRLRAEVEFGLNCPKPEPETQLKLGNLVQSGRETKTAVFLNRKALDKHIFVAGVTGSGKTTTCQRILLQSGAPFLVIEPAKTEYRILKNSKSCEDLIIFTLGSESVAPFRLNPMEFQRNESISSHVDMLKASLEAAFDMEAAIPQIIEAALYRCYTDFGWNIITGENSHYDDPFGGDTGAFPQLSDLLDMIPTVVREQGFDDRLRDEYIGSIRARLQSLVLGTKGCMLDTPRSVDWDALLDRKVVFEMEGIRSGSEKSFIMGLILSAFNEAVRERYLKTKKRRTHILLVEEAHRLLSRCIPGDSPNKRHGVETFADMLAEIRKYGECLIIADQIPNKMAEDVLKNTNTKIVHRIFAQDDKDAIGSTMALSREQKEFLSNLATGRAVLFSDGIGQAVQVQVCSETDTSLAPLADSTIRDRAFQYYYTECGTPVMCAPEGDLTALSPEQMERVRGFTANDIPGQIVKKWRQKTWDGAFARTLEEMLELKVFSTATLAEWALRNDWDAGAEVDPERRQAWERFFETYPEGEAAMKNQDLSLII